MGKYKINFFNEKHNRKITKNVSTKAEMGSISRNFDKNNVEYEGYKYGKNKETNRYGWTQYQSSNFCQICGRHLTDPDSIRRGIGPICAGKNRVPRDSNPSEDPRIKILNGAIAQTIIEAIPEFRRNECQFCNGELNHRVYYYEHEGGWFVESLNKKVWLWIECSKCGHQWSLQHLRVSQSTTF